MKRWYRKTVVKVIAVIVGIVSGAVFSASLLASISLAGTVNPTDIRRILTQAYEDSEDFNMTVENSVYEIMNRIRLEQMFETDGAYNPDKLVDIMEYSGNGTITGSNTSGVAYTLEDLENCIRYNGRYRRRQGGFTGSTQQEAPCGFQKPSDKLCAGLFVAGQLR